MTIAIAIFIGMIFVAILGLVLNKIVNTIEDLSYYVRAIDDRVEERTKKLDDQLVKNIEARLEVLEERVSVINHETIKREWGRKCKGKMK